MLHPNSLFSQYRAQIENLAAIDHDSILCDSFSLHRGSDLQIYYAPHNEYINERAQVLIVGITPGWSQTQRAYQTAQRGIRQNWTDEEICRQCKMESRFAGSMRRNLIAMLDALRLHERLSLASCAELFRPENTLLHTTSLIKYPCFYKGKNYSGHTPSIPATPILNQCVETLFAREARCLEDVRLVIPLGTAVESILQKLRLPAGQVLWGFPHPSGLNARRNIQFERNRRSMADILNGL